MDLTKNNAKTNENFISMEGILEEENYLEEKVSLIRWARTRR